MRQPTRRSRYLLLFFPQPDSHAIKQDHDVKYLHQGNDAGCRNTGRTVFVSRVKTIDPEKHVVEECMHDHCAPICLKWMAARRAWWKQTHGNRQKVNALRRTSMSLW